MSDSQKRTKRGRNVGGRPRIITLETVREVGELVAKGVPVKFACLLCGVKEETFSPAVSRNEQFRDAFDLELARFLKTGVELILAGEDKGGIKWLLTRRHGQHFTEHLRVNDAEDGPGAGFFTAEDVAEMKARARRRVEEEEEKMKKAE